MVMPLYLRTQNLHMPEIEWGLVLEKPDGISESTSDADSIHRPASGLRPMLDYLLVCGHANLTKQSFSHI